MKIQRPKNTKKKGFIEFFVYPERGKYVGICLTFDIVAEGKNPNELMRSLEEAARLHLKVVVEKKLSDNLLNRYAPEEYWDKYFDAIEKIKKIRLRKINSEVRQVEYNPKFIREGALAGCV